MGVPVLSKIDRPSVGCVGASILKPLGLQAWVVEDETAYIEKASAYASNLIRLTNCEMVCVSVFRIVPYLAAAYTGKIEAALSEDVGKERGQKAMKSSHISRWPRHKDCT